MGALSAPIGLMWCKGLKSSATSNKQPISQPIREVTEYRITQRYATVFFIRLWLQVAYLSVVTMRFKDFEVFDHCCQCASPIRVL